MIEFFAGRGNLSRCMRVSGRRTCSFDILYDATRPGRSKPYKSNAMDINSASGFALIVCKDVCHQLFGVYTLYRKRLRFGITSCFPWENTRFRKRLRFGITSCLPEENTRFRKRLRFGITSCLPEVRSEVYFWDPSKSISRYI